MNFKKLPKQKKQHLILTVVVTVLIMCGIGFGLITAQYDDIRGIGQKRQSEEEKYKRMLEAVKRADQIESESAELTRKLSEQESGMASGDLNSWIFSTVRQFKLAYRVDIPEIKEVRVEEVNLLPNFPYKQATVTVNGTGFYHDFGRFLADFENAFPLIRVVNLNLEPAPSSTANDAEKLSFRMDIVTLVKPEHI